MPSTFPPPTPSGRRLLPGLLLLFVACSDGTDGPEATSPDADAGGDEGSLDAQDLLDEPDAAVEVWEQPETTMQCPGGTGCTCATPLDCDSGLCLETSQGLACAQPCATSCPKGYRCAAVPQSADVLLVCVAAHARLCSPCLNNGECGHAGVTDARCVDRGDSGQFCGSACSADEDCPPGYACKTAQDVGGQPTTQCLPAGADGSLGPCLCTVHAVELGLETVCRVSRVEGGQTFTCVGEARCLEAGASAICEASTPATEACNGEDDDCDGSTDEASCDDLNPCTQDTCDGTAGCAHDVLDGQPCDADGSACTQGDHCEGATCLAGAAKDCDDLNPCTLDTCEPATGCVHAADDGAPCDDENTCTIGDVCAAKQCQPGVLKECTSPGPCYTSSCDPITGKCTTESALAGLACDDGNACTSGDACDEGKCNGAPLNCDDANPCTDDTCDAASGCGHAANTASCDDGDKCTLLDVCQDAQCAPGKAKACDDGEPCTVDTCNKSSGACVFDGVEPDGKLCDADGSVCTAGDSCSDGVCVAGQAKNCQDENPCTTDSCDAKVGCANVANTAGCDDGTACTKSDVCAGGKCTGTPVTCNDGNPCTDDTCDKAKGCVNSPNASACTDGNACTGTDLCGGGTCAGAAIACDDKDPCTADSCDVGKGCLATPLSEQHECGADGTSWCIAGACVPKPACGPGYEAVKIDDGGVAKTACAALGPVWGNRPESPVAVYSVQSIGGQNVVVDSQTKLMWQQTTAPSKMPWTEANTHCDQLVHAGFKDWRLPSVHELASLVDYGKPMPVIDQSAFPQTPPTQYWTGSLGLGLGNARWWVCFGTGRIAPATMSVAVQARCVRGGRG